MPRKSKPINAEQQYLSPRQTSADFDSRRLGAGKPRCLITRPCHRVPSGEPVFGKRSLMSWFPRRWRRGF